MAASIDVDGLSPIQEQAIVALLSYLLFRGRRVHAWLMAGLGDECGRCGYNLRGITGGKCPECGERIGRG